MRAGSFSTLRTCSGARSDSRLRVTVRSLIQNPMSGRATWTRLVTLFSALRDGVRLAEISELLDFRNVQNRGHTCAADGGGSSVRPISTISAVKTEERVWWPLKKCRCGFGHQPEAAVGVEHAACDGDMFRLRAGDGTSDNRTIRAIAAFRIMNPPCGRSDVNKGDSLVSVSNPSVHEVVILSAAKDLLLAERIEACILASECEQQILRRAEALLRMTIHWRQYPDTIRRRIVPHTTQPIASSVRIAMMPCEMTQYKHHTSSTCFSMLVR